MKILICKAAVKYIVGFNYKVAQNENTQVQVI